MDSFKSYLLRDLYRDIEKLGDRLAEVEPLIDWEAFRPIISGLYSNQGPLGGRPNVNEVVMVKLLVLQAWYGLSDPELERQASDRISFRRFLGYSESIPDQTTVWSLRERLAETGRDRQLWAELQRQLDEKGFRVRKGVSQDASFITADPGPSGRPRGDEARTRRSRDGDWAKRRTGSVYGYKLHAKADNDHGLVRDLEVTTASVHDSRVDLSLPGEAVYRDKGYFGVEPRGFNATMRRGARGHPLSVWDRMRNARISRRRAPVERVFAVLKRVFGGGHVLVTSLARVRVRLTFCLLCFNVVRLRGLV
jgi:IS5 family transposase